MRTACRSHFNLTIFLTKKSKLQFSFAKASNYTKGEKIRENVFTSLLRSADPPQFDFNLTNFFVEKKNQKF